MLEITDELNKKLDRILAKGERNRNKILNLLISNDKELKKIFALYKMQKNEYDVMLETKIPVETVRKSMENIDVLSRLIDRKIVKINIERFNSKNKANRDEDDELEL